MPPALDEQNVARLTELASQLDGIAGPAESEALVKEFNCGAGTELGHSDFQGISGGTDHETWVRGMLSEPFAKPIPDVSRDELIEVTRRIAEAEGEEHEINFWLALLEANVPDPQVSDLIFWPNHYFRDESATDLTPEQIVDIALARNWKPTALPPPSPLN